MTTRTGLDVNGKRFRMVVTSHDKMRIMWTINGKQVKKGEYLRQLAEAYEAKNSTVEFTK